MMNSPFYNAFFQSDFLGKLIYLSLLFSSVVSWIVLIQKIYLTNRVRKNSKIFFKVFHRFKDVPLNIEGESRFKTQEPNPFYELYLVLKKSTIDILNKNHRFGSDSSLNSFLTSSDIDCISSHLVSNMDLQTKNLEKNLFILSTIAGLAPLLGLLGTVWGILTTFSHLGVEQVGSANQMVLSGLSLALTTTVLGLLIAIPALIAYNYLKNAVFEFEREMEGFSNAMLSSVEIQYRRVD